MLPVKMTSPNPWNVDDPVKHEAPPPISSPINFFCVRPILCSPPQTIQISAQCWQLFKTQNPRIPLAAPFALHQWKNRRRGAGPRFPSSQRGPKRRTQTKDLQFLAKFNFNTVELFFHWTHQNILTIDAEGAEATGHPGFPHDRSPRVMATRDHPNPA